jgi:hypothetical protein
MLAKLCHPLSRHRRSMCLVAVLTVSIVPGLYTIRAAATGTWTSNSALPTYSTITGAEAFSNPLAGSLLFFARNSVPTIAPVSANGTVGTSVPVPAVTGLFGFGTPGKIAFLATGAAIVTWTLTSYGTSYMAYRSPAGAWGKPVETPSGFSNLAVTPGKVLTSEANGTGVSIENWALSPTGALTLASGPTSVYTGQPLFNQSWVALDPGGSAALIVLGSTDDGDTESVTEVMRTAKGVWSGQTTLSGIGAFAQSVAFATAPGGASIVSWVTGQTAFAASSATAIRQPGHAFSAPTPTGSDSSSNGAYLLAAAAAGADGTLAVAITDKVYTTPYVYTASTTARIVQPHGTQMSGPVGVPSAALPETLGAGHGSIIIGTVVATYSAGNASYASSYKESQKTVVDIVSPKSVVSADVLGGSSGLYDGNGGDGCGCPQSPPPASVTGDALDLAGNGVVVGQLTPGGLLQSARYVVPAAPSAPLKLKAVSGKAKITLAWSAPGSDGGSAITGYNLYLGTKSGAEGVKPINPKPISATKKTFVATRLKKAMKYFFVVRAFNAVGTSSASNQASATPS